MQLPDRLRLAHLPTPIQKLTRLSNVLNKEIYVWRDDLTGCLESGNKIRKLEFVLAEAVRQKATRLITCGGPQSNHARATAILGRRLGIPTTIVMREPKVKDSSGDPVTGNLLLDRIFGAEIIPVAYEDYASRGCLYDSFLGEASEAARKRGENPFVIGEGASTPLGTLGYYAAVEEIEARWRETGFTSIICALGSGGTHAGLALGFARWGLGPERVWAVNVCDSAPYFTERVGRLMEKTVENYGLRVSLPSLQILDGYVGDGYARTSPAELSFYVDRAREEGILLDPVYTGKAFRGMMEEIRKDGSRFGDKILFLHSGGTLATFAYAKHWEGVV